MKGEGNFTKYFLYLHFLVVDFCTGLIYLSSKLQQEIFKY
jgi:hypothetical protein